jgi:hypothetical protein
MKTWQKILLWVIGIALGAAVLMGIFFYLIISQSHSW